MATTRTCLLCLFAWVVLLIATPAQAERYRLFNRFRLVPSVASRAGMANAAPGGVGSRLNGGAVPLPFSRSGTLKVERENGPTKVPPPSIIIDHGIKVIYH